MKTKILFFSAAIFFVYTTASAQTSYGGLIGITPLPTIGTAGNGGDNTNSYFGHGAGINNGNAGIFNTFIGGESGNSNTNGDYNTFLGYLSGSSNTGGSNNTFIGTVSGSFNVNGDDNTFLGGGSGQEHITGNGNTFIGADSGWLNSSGANNTFLGYNSGAGNQTGSGNVFLGHQAGSTEFGSNLLYIDNSSTSSPLIWGDFAANMLRFNGSVRITDIAENMANDLTHVLVEDADGDIFWRDAATLTTDNTFPSYPESAGDGGDNTNAYFGHEAGNVNTGTQNTFIGYQSGLANNAGLLNTFIGYESGDENTSGDFNTFVGGTSGTNHVSGDGNTFLGRQSGFLHQTGPENVFVGERSGYSNINGSGNVFIGREAGFNEMGSSFLYIDNSSTSSPLIWGDFAANVLEFNGNVRITGIPQDDGLTHVLVEDASGNIFWRDATSLGGAADDQMLSLTGDNLELEDGGSVDLSAYLDNTDAQTLSYDNGTYLLSIAGGNNVDLSSLSGGGSQNLLSVLGQGNNAGGNNLTNVGSIGIGTATPDAAAALDVNGAVKIGDVDINTPGDYNLYVEAGILTEKVKVAVKTESEWSDHVFEKDYELKPLEKVEAFVTKNKHLPGIPSASAVVKEGIDLAQMDARLLEKIEELTLYTIEQDKTLKQQKKLMEQLIKRIETLEKQ